MIFRKQSKYVLFLLIPLLFSCSPNPNPDTGDTNNDDNNEVVPNFTMDDFLCVDGKLIKNNSGQGVPIMLKGTNAGGYLVIEQWMTAFDGDSAFGYYDHKKTTDIFMKRFGYENTLDLWEYYRDNYWTDYDFVNCKEMAMNVIRLPFSHFSCDPEFNNVKKIPGQKYNFELLDNFVRKAAEYGMYTILDMHGTYGSHNGQDHSGEALNWDQVDFYRNEEKMSKTVDLWKAISNHFKDNPAVAGYDLLNEPGEKASPTGKIHWDFLDRVYDAIRSNGDKHITIFEACWDGPNLPQPSLYGWTNCMYSFHNYSGESDADKNLESMLNKIRSAEGMNFDVPLFMGEFNCYGNEESWVSTLSLFNSRQWHWTSWTYKLNRLDNRHFGWGIFYSQAPKVKPNEDSIETIKEKWYKIDTAHEDSYLMRFNSYNTLFNVMKTYCGQ